MVIWVFWGIAVIGCILSFFIGFMAGIYWLNKNESKTILRFKKPTLP